MGQAFNIASLSMIALLAAWSLAFFLSTAFSYGTDITQEWQSLESLAEHCINIAVQQVAFATSDVITDFMVLCLPLLPLW